MDSAAFATSRIGIELPNSGQRSLAFPDLALAEANDAVEYRDDDIDETTQEDRAKSVRRARAKPRPKLSRRPRSVRVAAGPAFEGRRRSNRQLWLPSLWRV